MARSANHLGAARGDLKRAGGLLRAAGAELAALENERLGELELTGPDDLPRAEELLELVLAQYGRVHLTVSRVPPQPHHGARRGRGGAT